MFRPRYRAEIAWSTPSTHPPDKRRTFPPLIVPTRFSLAWDSTQPTSIHAYNSTHPFLMASRTNRATEWHCVLNFILCEWESTVFEDRPRIWAISLYVLP